MLLHSNIIGEGKPFVILHGFLGMGDNWKTLGSQFSEQGFQVHLVDQRNHGRSFHDDEFNYEVLVEDLKHYCDAYKLSEIVLLGHSMGGKTAMLFATLYPEIVSKLLVADISPRFYPIHHDAILNGLSELDFDTIKTRGEADKILSNYRLMHFQSRLFQPFAHFFFCISTSHHFVFTNILFAPSNAFQYLHTSKHVFVVFNIQ